MEDELFLKKREKANRYAAEPERFTVQAIKFQMRSEHGTRSIFYVGGNWHCDCDFFKERNICSHTMAASQIFIMEDGEIHAEIVKGGKADEAAISH